jgi:hypothetical protein
LSNGLLTRVEHEQESGFRKMESARYHRAQAELCLQMARHMSDPASANMLRANATRHFALATELENQEALARPVLKSCGPTTR